MIFLIALAVIYAAIGLGYWLAQLISALRTI